jgi:hypothetical protein
VLRSMSCGLICSLTLLAALPAQSPAQEWALKMFDSTAHDFHTVARGAKVIHRFKVKNLYEEDAHISGVRSSCGCTTPQIVKPDLKTHEVGEIVAEFNTRSFMGFKQATVTVTFDRPFPAEVQLSVSGFIRTDVVLQPGSVDLGTVDVGTAVEKKIAVTYAGREDWKILDAKTANPHFEVELVETGRGGGRVSYDMLVRLTKDAPSGYIKDRLLLVTSDDKGTELPVDIEGRVVSAFTVSPASLFMGVVQPGQRVSKQLVVRGKKPFRILSIDCNNNQSFSIDPPSEPKMVHQVPVVFTAGEKPGKITQLITVRTDQGDEAVAKCTAYAQVVDGPMAEDATKGTPENGGKSPNVPAGAIAP